MCQQRQALTKTNKQTKKTHLLSKWETQILNSSNPNLKHGFSLCFPQLRNYAMEYHNGNNKSHFSSGTWAKKRAEGRGCVNSQVPGFAHCKGCILHLIIRNRPPGKDHPPVCILLRYNRVVLFCFRILHDIHLANSGRKNPDVFALIWSSRNDKLPSSPYTRSTHEKRKSKRVVKMSFKKINILLQPKSPHILAIKSFTLLL